MNFDPSKILLNMEKVRSAVVNDGKRRAVRAGARVIADAMIDRAPVLDRELVGSTALPPGAVRDSIKARTVTRKDGEPMGIAGPAGDDVRVAGWIEYGHRQIRGGYNHMLADGRTQGPGRDLGEDVPPHPFLRPAFESSVAAAKDAVDEVIRETFQEATRG